MTKWKRVSLENVTLETVKPLVECPATVTLPNGIYIGTAMLEKMPGAIAMLY
jgi:hypothetical protein